MGNPVSTSDLSVWTGCPYRYAPPPESKIRTLLTHDGVYSSRTAWLHSANGAPSSTLDRDHEGATVEIRGDGRSIEIYRTKREGGQDPDPPIREEGDITRFSAASRRRLMALFNRCRRDADCIFLTLTYHRRDPPAEEAKEHLNALRSALSRRWSDVRASVVWRMEFQERGQIHFHLLVYGLRYDAKEALKRIWHRISGEKDAWRRHRLGPDSHGNHLPFEIEDVESVTSAPLHAYLGAWVEGLSSEEDSTKAAHYVSKYHCKEEEADDRDHWTGRRWGVWWRKHLPIAEVSARFEVSYAVGYELVALVLNEWGSDHEFVPHSLFIGAEDPIEYAIELVERARRAAE